MIPLGIRLSLNGGKESLFRLFAIAGGVIVGTTLLLFMLSGLRLLNGTLDQSCWRCTGQDYPSLKGSTTTDPLHWSKDATVFDAKTIEVYNVAKTGPNTPVIPGIDRIPGPGEYYASPALAKLLQQAPDDQLDDRFAGKMIGQIERPGLIYPRDLIAIVGHTPTELPLTPDLEDFWSDPNLWNIRPHERNGGNSFTYLVWTINEKPKPRFFDPTSSAMFVVGMGGLLFSVLALIATATRLSASRRESKFAALRLFGATPKQINQLAAIDAAIGAGIGALLGIGLFYLVRPALAAAISSLEIVSFFPDDLRPSLFHLIAVIVGAPLLAAGAAIISLRKVRISPLGVARRTTPKPPSAWRMVLMPIGALLMTGVWWVNRHVEDTQTRSELVPVFLIGFLILLFGLIIAGPWLTMVLTQLLAKRAKSASSLLAFRRLADNPVAAFRTVNVLVLATLLCTFLAALSPQLLDPYKTITSDRPEPVFLDRFLSSGQEGQVGVPLATIQPILDDLAKIPGVQPVIGYSFDQNPDGQFQSMLVECADLPKLELEHCEPGKTVAALPFGFGGPYGIPTSAFTIEYPTPPADYKQHALHLIINVGRDQANADRVRTTLLQHGFPGDEFFKTRLEIRRDEQNVFKGVRYTINSLFLLILFIASCSLAVSVAGGLVERKRPFGLLRTTGTSLRQLAKVVVLESLVPLLAAMALSVGLGLGVAVLLVESFAATDTPNVTGLPLDFYLIVAAGAGVAILITLATMPLLAALTKPDTARFE